MCEKFLFKHKFKIKLKKRNCACFKISKQYGYLEIIIIFWKTLSNIFILTLTRIYNKTK